MIFLTHGSNRTWIPSLSKPSTIGWSFRMDRAQRNSYSCQQSKEATTFHRWKWRLRCWDLAFVSCWNTTEMMNWWTGHVNEEYSAGLAHQWTTNQVSGYDVTRISTSGISYPTCVIAEDSREVVQLDQGGFRQKNDQFVVLHDQRLASGKVVLIRQEGIPTTTADGLEFVQMEEDGFQQMSTMWIRPDHQTHIEQMRLPGSSHTIQIPTWPRAINPGAWITSVVKDGSVVFVDLNEPTYNPLSELFISLRLDIAINCQNMISTLELTICHETNMKASKQFKSSKYNTLYQNLSPEFPECELLNNTVEVSSLGFISDIFCVFKSQFNWKNAWAR